MTCLTRLDEPVRQPHRWDRPTVRIEVQAGPPEDLLTSTDLCTIALARYIQRPMTVVRIRAVLKLFTVPTINRALLRLVAGGGLKVGKPGAVEGLVHEGQCWAEVSP